MQTKIDIPSEKEIKSWFTKGRIIHVFMQIEYWRLSRFYKSRYKTTAICRYYDKAQQWRFIFTAELFLVCWLRIRLSQFNEKYTQHADGNLYSLLSILYSTGMDRLQVHLEACWIRRRDGDLCSIRAYLAAWYRIIQQVRNLFKHLNYLKSKEKFFGLKY